MIDALAFFQRDKSFEEAVARYGGSLSPLIYVEHGSAGDSFRQLFEEPLVNVWGVIQDLSSAVPAAQPIFSELKLGYVCNPLAQARILRTPQNTVIGVYSGFVDLVAQSASILFATPGVFPSIGDPTQEIWRRREFGGSDTVDILAVLKDGFRNQPIPQRRPGYTLAPWIRPIDDMRYYAAQLVTVFAVEFAFFHELGHLLCGHSDYLKSMGVTQGDLPQDIRYLMEFDGDCMAAQLSAGTGLISPRTSRKPRFQNFWRDDPTSLFDRSMLAYLWTVAANLVMFLFYQDEITIANWSQDYDHPHPLYRIINLGNLLTRRGVRTDSELIDDLESQFIPALDDLRSAWVNYSIPGRESLQIDFRKWESAYREVEGVYDRAIRAEGSFKKLLYSRGFDAAGDAVIKHLARETVCDGD